jgi:hypothetical protein
MTAQAGNVAGNFDSCIMGVRSEGEPQQRSKQWVYDQTADAPWSSMTVRPSLCVCVCMYVCICIFYIHTSTIGGKSSQRHKWYVHDQTDALWHSRTARPCLSVCLSVCLSFCLSVCCVCLSAIHVCYTCVHVWTLSTYIHRCRIHTYIQLAQ